MDAADGDLDAAKTFHKKRSKNWTRPETLKLIKVRSEMEERFTKSGRKMELWDEVSDKLQAEYVNRDAQQCRDKWEKLTAGYKEVRDGLREKDDNPFYDDLHYVLGGKPLPKSSREEEEEEVEEKQIKKLKKKSRSLSGADVAAVQGMVEAVMKHQQKMLREMLDALEKRDQVRLEREEKWRAEERSQRVMFNNAMLQLLQKLANGSSKPAAQANTTLLEEANNSYASLPKKRSKNWRRGEVLQMIRLRGDMDERFVKSNRRQNLWDELAEQLAVVGVNRDGKQCREKWDKLTAEYKDVLEGKKDQHESPYYHEIVAVTSRSERQHSLEGVELAM
eukprot:SM000006S19319  [mRNA]  locus=s6:18759:20871:+ [translate_table: standard]